MKFNKEEIELCKKIAEKYRKDIEYGDWYCDSNYSNEIRLLHSLDRGKIHGRSQKELDVFFLWTISDCLEFLEEKGWSEIVIEVSPVYYNNVKCFAERGEVEKGYEREVIGEGKTPLEACLKAVLVVLKEAS